MAPCPLLGAALYAIGGSICRAAGDEALARCPATLHVRSAGIDAGGAAGLADGIAASVRKISLVERINQ
jgi:hypothetical protein